MPKHLVWFSGLLFMSALHVACTDFFKPTEADVGSPFSEKRLVSSLTVDVGYAGAKNLLDQSKALNAAIGAYCETFNPSDLAEAKQSWRAAYSQLAELRMMQFGPSVEEKKAIFPALDVFPFLSACNADEAVVATHNGTLFDAKVAPPGRKGLGAIETLLFDEKGSYRCLEPKDAAVKWTRLPIEEKRKDQCVVMKSMAVDIVLQSQALYNVWNREFNNYEGTVFAKMSASASSATEIRNQITNAIYYLEVVRDVKLLPLVNLSPNCADLHCLDKVENSYSGTPLETIKATLVGARKLINGPEGSAEANNSGGLGKLIGVLGQSDLTVRLLQAIEKPLATIEELKAQGSSLELAREYASKKKTCEVNVAGPATLCRLYSEVESLIGLLRSDYASVLSAKAPVVLEGDNDGGG